MTLDYITDRVAVDARTGCWMWTLALTPKGYARAAVNCVRHYGHRLAWQLARGPIPDGLCVCHSCDVLHAEPLAYRRCVNPDHLWLGTNADNTADMIAKGRAVYVRGERHGRSRARVSP